MLFVELNVTQILEYLHINALQICEFVIVRN